MPYAQGLPFARGSHTSYKAAVRQQKTRGVKLARLLDAYREAASGGLTGCEASARTGLPIQSICSLRAKLEADGLIAKGGARMGAYGHSVTVWFALGDGL